jgi:ABC-type nitrate/sulfonate/bicarbonate transport system substrate-binding protein
MLQSSTRQFSRRYLLRAAVSVAGCLGMASLLEACGSSASAPGAAPTSAGAGAAPATPASATASGPIGTPGGTPEQANLKLGLPLDATSFLPIYVAATGPWKDQGLNIEILSFRGDADVAQALAGDSVDLSVASINGLINLINSGQPVMGFYAGFYPADFAWLAQPAIKTWADLKGKSTGVSTYGSLTDFLTRYVLRKHGLEPEKDVQIVQAGGTPSAFEAIRAGKLDAGIISPPFKYTGQDEGLTVLGTQDKEVAPQWPKHIFMAKTRLLNEKPNTVTAVLRAHVAAVRLATKNRDLGVKTMVDRLKYTEANASRAYDEVITQFNERGELPAESMPVFWNLAQQSGDVTEPWPESRFLDRRYIDSFAQWAPAAT